MLPLPTPDSLKELCALIAQHCHERRTSTAIPRVGLVRSDTPTLPMGVVYQPMLYIVAQGAKQALLGDNIVEYAAGQYLVVSVDLPITGSVIQACPEAPYLALSLELDPAVLSDMLLSLPGTAQDAPLPGLAVSPVTPDLLDAAVRLLRLLGRPADIPMLAPLAEREILYRLLTGAQAPMLRQIALAHSRMAQVGQAIGWIRSHFAEPLRIDDVAQRANMSASTFHRHFKAVTAMSPLQYQKQIRLQEARRLLLAGQADAASIGFTVGYESPSQFSREYARMYGQPPLRDAVRLRGLGPLVAV
ncbi:AraC-like DNA-binding protein [Rhodoferax ferrireducens]|uniref:AraC-like DNA-binding protein n=1 Tax=Rhodoferax ferrireducens TaxID=192843 RepID=A0ABU2CC51_9BURK|nr:AraC family transcriptional regulator [Rhodoferax ferrireducens]MDR7378881.1 AraC-like DNA-binding protein [Rhodoferax ferrireducens]